MAPLRHPEPISSESERRAIRREFSASLMSNTKWREVFIALESTGMTQGVFQFFGAPAQRRMNLPMGSLISDRYILDSVEVGPYPYYSILWLDLHAQSIPASKEQIPGAWHHQDIAAARNALALLGQLPIADISNGFRISAYSK